MDVKLPSWIWALIIWAICLVVCIVAALVLPPLWTVPNEQFPGYTGQLSDYKSCGDNCSLFRDHLFLTIRRKDQCEAPHFTATTTCDIAQETGVDPKSCGSTAPSGKLCGTATVIEPQNTWSNFGYLLVGLLILFRRPPRLLGIMVGVNFCLIALFSGLYHASLQGWAQAFDVGWIYALLFSMIAYAHECFAVRYGGPDHAFPVRLSAVLGVLPILFGLAISLIPGFKGMFDSTTATIMLLIFLAVPLFLIFYEYDLKMEPMYGRDWLGNWWGPVGARSKFFLMLIPLALIAFICRLEDGCGHPWCSPHGFFLGIQSHALWHVLGGFALGITFAFLDQAACDYNWI